MWDEAQEYYLTDVSNTDVQAASTLDPTLVSGEPEVEDERYGDRSEEVQVVEPITTHAAGRTIDSFLQEQNNLDKVEEDMSKAFADSNRNNRNKLCGELVARFMEVLSSDDSLSTREKYALADEMAEHQMNKNN